MNDSILIVPACEPCRGGGHLVRCMTLVKELRALGRETFLCLNSDKNNLLQTADFDRSWIITEAALHEKKWDIIVLDRFQTPEEELSRWKQIAPVIGIDEGGIGRDRFDFLIDILPNIEKIKPNISDPALLPLPAKKQSLSFK